MSKTDGSMGPVLARFWERLGLSPEELERARFSSRRYPPVIEFVAPTPPAPGETLLDLGGGLGSLSVALHARFGGEYHLADFQVPTPTRQAVLAEMGVRQSFAVRLDQPNALRELPTTYDWILFTEVLEHLLTNPLTLFREIHDHLRPGGRLLLTTPNQARASNRVKLALGRSIKEKDRFPLDGTPGYGHVMEYTMDELTSLLRWESFRIERTTVIQNLPSMRTTRRQRTLVRLLNTPLAAGLGLGDDMLVLARTEPRPSRNAPASGRV